MSYNPNGPRNAPGTSNLGNTGTSGLGSGLGSSGLGSTSGSGSGSSMTPGTSRTGLESSSTGGSSAADTAEGLRVRAEEIAGQVRERAGELGSQVSERAGQAVNTVGERMTDVAHLLRDRAPESVAPYAARAAQGLEAAGHYLQSQTAGDFFDDLAGIVRRNPVPSMLTGVALGFLLARNSRR